MISYPGSKERTKTNKLATFLRYALLLSLLLSTPPKIDTRYVCKVSVCIIQIIHTAEYNT